MRFVNRADAGRRLAARLEHLRGRPMVVVGLPRGGVVVAAEVAQALGAPLDVILVRKLGVPTQPELAMGALGEEGARIINDDIVRRCRVSADDVRAVEELEAAELCRRAQEFRAGCPPVSLAGKTVVIVDDGIATGSTAEVACRVARLHGADKVVVAVPVAPPEAAARFLALTDEYVCLHSPRAFFSVGQFYEQFEQTTDEEVMSALHRSAWVRDEPVEVDDRGAVLRGDLTVPIAARGLVVFAHGSGSSRRSPRNRAVANDLNEHGMATLLFDLLTVGEEADRANVFDIPTLAHRLGRVTATVRTREDLAGLKVGYFGASTGAGAALWAAAEPDAGIDAIVSRGGRPDLAEPRLPSVSAPTLLIVGGEDRTVLAMNRRAQGWLRCANRLVVVPGATHLFEEPGAMDAVRDAAREWFQRHLGGT